jgi:hypothetical protein
MRKRRPIEVYRNLYASWKEDTLVAGYPRVLP